MTPIEVLVRWNSPITQPVKEEIDVQNGKGGPIVKKSFRFLDFCESKKQNSEMKLYYINCFCGSLM